MSVKQNGWDKLNMETKEQINTPEKIDPGINPSEIAYDRMKQLIKDVSSVTLRELTSYRDQIDNLMIAIRKRDEALTEAVTQHSEFCVNAIKMKQIVSDSIAKIQIDFNSSDNSVLSLIKNEEH